MTDGEPEFRFAEAMICPSCGSVIPPSGYHEIDDEKSDGTVMCEATWTCPTCDHVTRDWEGGFVFPVERDEPATQDQGSV